MKKTFTQYAILAKSKAGSKANYNLQEALYTNGLNNSDVVIFTGSKKDVETLYNQIIGDGDGGSVDILINGEKYSVYGYGSKRFFNPALYPNREKAPLGLLNQYKNYRKA